MFFGIMIDPSIFLPLLFLVFLEGVLSVDNALVLAMMVKHLPPEQQKRALTYGIWGAFAFRVISLFLITWIMALWWVKLLGGAYLLYIAISNLWFSKGSGDPVEPMGTKEVTNAGLWRTVVAVEMMDIAFSVDSILAAVSLTQKYWMVLTGGILGIIMMRYAATVFIKLLHRFPKLEDTAYLLVLVIGLKLSIQGFELPYINFHDSNNAASWVFWGSMIACIIHGLRNGRKTHASKV